MRNFGYKGIFEKTRNFQNGEFLKKVNFFEKMFLKCE